MMPQCGSPKVTERNPATTHQLKERTGVHVVDIGHILVLQIRIEPFRFENSFHICVTLPSHFEISPELVRVLIYIAACCIQRKLPSKWWRGRPLATRTYVRGAFVGEQGRIVQCGTS